jgi:DNA polymerase-4
MLLRKEGVILYEKQKKNCYTRCCDRDLFFVNNDMTACWTKQRKLPVATNISGEIAFSAFSLFKKTYGHWPLPLRKIGVRGCDLIGDVSPRQVTVFEDAEKMRKKEDLEWSINILRARYGNKCVQRAVMYTDGELSGVDAKKDHTIHPSGVFNGGMTVSWGGYTTTIMQSGSH